jgi:2-phosphosulfolactate phosphatase
VIDVALTPRELRPSERIVVIDLLRATSTATWALAGGYARVRFADSLHAALALRSPGRVIAGERECVMPAGFDQGNSPADAAVCRGDELVLATTNGTPAIVAATRAAATVLLGCMVNLAALCERLAETDTGGDLLILCSGTNGAVAIEDVYLAGRITAELYGPRTDATLLAEAVARAYRTPIAAIAASSNAAVLRAAGLSRDLADCARESAVDVVPEASAGEDRTSVAVALVPNPVAA